MFHSTPLEACCPRPPARCAGQEGSGEPGSGRAGQASAVGFGGELWHQRGLNDFVFSLHADSPSWGALGHFPWDSSQNSHQKNLPKPNLSQYRNCAGYQNVSDVILSCILSDLTSRSCSGLELQSTVYSVEMSLSVKNLEAEETRRQRFQPGRRAGWVVQKQQKIHVEAMDQNCIS